ncbi:LysE family translocator [Rhodobacteraceae bacterium NNCM2]|nr:LysE family translocator [Coraliihabitans acroporae]
MLPLETAFAFAAATLLFAYMPGPALLYTAAQTIARGRRAGFMAALGIHVGCYAHVLAAAAGLSVIFESVPVLYTALKIAGACYLIWLGLGMILKRERPSEGAVPIPARSARRAFIDSIVVELLNPKVALFFIAFLPQFTDPAAALPIWAQFLILGTIVNMTFTSADLVCVMLAGAVTERLRSSPRAAQLTRRVGGTMLVGLGAHFALQRS